MRPILESLLFIFILTVYSITAQNGLPKVFTLNANALYTLRTAYQKGEMKDNKGIKQLLKEAANFLKEPPLSVCDKKQVPPSGDKHDFISMAPYWWPNPNTKDNLPYIRKDGERNPEYYNYPDEKYFNVTVNEVEKLALAFYLTGNESYSEKAVELISVWFLNPESKMNPNLNYAQFIPGITTGRGAGFIEVHNIYKIIDAFGLLEKSKNWSKEIDAGIKKWFTDFQEWMINSKIGKEEANALNNHGSWYDVQMVSISLFLDKTEFAKNYLNGVMERRISVQIKGDGTQPLELVRTKSWNYSIFNLAALTLLSSQGDKTGIDLWSWKNKEGGSIRKALDYLLSFLPDTGKWEHKQIVQIKIEELYPILNYASKKENSKIYSELKSKILKNGADIDIMELLK